MNIKVFFRVVFCFLFCFSFCLSLYCQTNVSVASEKAYEEAFLANSSKQQEIESYNAIQRAFTLYTEGNIAFLNNDYQKAITLYTESIDINPTVNCYYNRALAYSFVAKSSEATISEKFYLYNKSIEDYTLAIAITPSDSSLYNNRAIMYIKLGNIEQAEADFEVAKNLAADDSDILDNISKFNEKYHGETNE